jgi:hypothetical protein
MPIKPAEFLHHLQLWRKNLKYTTHKSHMTIDLNELPLEGPEDGVPDLNIVIPFDPPQQHRFHPFDLNILVDETGKWHSIAISGYAFYSYF